MYGGQKPLHLAGHCQLVRAHGSSKEFFLIKFVFAGSTFLLVNTHPTCSLFDLWCPSGHKRDLMTNLKNNSNPFDFLILCHRTQPIQPQVAQPGAKNSGQPQILFDIEHTPSLSDLGHRKSVFTI